MPPKAQELCWFNPFSIEQAAKDIFEPTFEFKKQFKTSKMWLNDDRSFIFGWTTPLNCLYLHFINADGFSTMLNFMFTSITYIVCVRWALWHANERFLTPFGSFLILFFYSLWKHAHIYSHHLHLLNLLSRYLADSCWHVPRVVAGTLSWSRRKTAAQRPPAPYRRGKWRSAWARHRCSPRDRCACRAGTGSGRHTQSPSCRSHTLWSSCRRALIPGQRCPGEGVGWGRCAVRCGPAPPLSAAWPGGSDWVWGGTPAPAPAPGMVAEALRADSPPRTRWAGTDHQRLEKTDSSPLSWPCTTAQTLQNHVYVAFTNLPGSSCVQGARFPQPVVSAVCLTLVWKNKQPPQQPALRFSLTKYTFQKAVVFVNAYIPLGLILTTVNDTHVM